MTPAGEAIRFEYDLESVPGVSGVQYHIAVGAEVWSLTVTSDERSTLESIADAVAATFAPGPTGG